MYLRHPKINMISKVANITERIAMLTLVDESVLLTEDEVIQPALLLGSLQAQNQDFDLLLNEGNSL